MHMRACVDYVRGQIHTHGSIAYLHENVQELSGKLELSFDRVPDG